MISLFGFTSCQLFTPSETTFVSSPLCPNVAAPTGLAGQTLPEGGLYLLTDDEILHVEKTGTKINVTNRIEHDSAQYARIASGEEDSRVYANTSNAIHTFDENLNALGSFEFKHDVMDFAIQNDHLFVLSDTALWIIDYRTPQNPRYVTQVDFPAEKPGHHIVIREQNAYVLDNVVMPVYLHLVNIRNPRSPQLHTLQWDGVNPYLADQYVNDNGWYVLERSNTIFGMFQSVAVLTPEFPIGETGVIGLPSWAREPNLDETDEYFYMLQQITSRDGLLVGAGTEIAAEGYSEGNLVVGVIDPSSSSPSLMDHLCLPDNAQGRQPQASEMLQHGNSLYIAGANGLYVLDFSRDHFLTFAGLISTDSPVLSLSWAK